MFALLYCKKDHSKNKLSFFFTYLKKGLKIHRLQKNVILHSHWASLY